MHSRIAEPAFPAAGIACLAAIQAEHLRYVASQSATPGPRAPAQRPPPQQFDSLMKSLLENRCMVEGLVRAHFSPSLVDRLDFSQLSEANPVHVTEAGIPSISDGAWQVPLKNGREALTFLLEFQATVDPKMPLRSMLSYAQAKMKHHRPRGARDEKPPLMAVVPVVIYHGKG